MQEIIEGKRVLVHCQQGASRSASLIIAYGLYRNPGMSVNDSYYAAQSKSRWISPNMRLMYCLQDFQKEVQQKKMPRSAAASRSGRSPTKHHRMTLSADAIDVKPKEPLTAPLPDSKTGANKDDSLGPDRSPTHARGKSTPNLESISPGPSSAPSSFWSETPESTESFQPGRFNFNHDAPSRPPPHIAEAPQIKEFAAEPSASFPPSSFVLSKPPPSPRFPPPALDLKPPSLSGQDTSAVGLRPPPSPGFGAHRFGGTPQSLGFTSLNLAPQPQPPTQRAFPLVNKAPKKPALSMSRSMSSLTGDGALMSPRAEMMTNNPLHDSFGEMAGMKFVEAPAEPAGGLFSPRESKFPRNPFGAFGRPAQVVDPRSPPTKGEAPIVRSIDELL